MRHENMRFFQGLSTLLVGVFCICACMWLCGCTSDETDSQQSPEQAPLASNQSSEQTASVNEKPTWTPTDNCLECHVRQADTSDTSTLGYLHTQQLGLTCDTCHNDTEHLTTVHEEASAEQAANLRWKKIRVSQTACTSSGCHDLASDELVALTKNSTVLTDDEGTCVNPHLVADMTPAHVSAQMGCPDCHTMHVNRDANLYCSSCHHEGVYACGTCHA